MVTPTIQRLRDIGRHLVDPELAVDIIEHLPDAIVMVDSAGMIMIVNRQAELLFGYPRSEMYDQPVEMLIPEAVREKHAQHRQDFAGEPRTRPMGVGLVLSAISKDGREFPAEINLSPLVTPDGLLVMAVIRKRRPG